MSHKFNFKLMTLCTLLSAMLVVPALGQGKEAKGARYKAQQDKIIKDLKLAPEKEKAVLAVKDKYAQERPDIIANIKKSSDELKAALAAATPDEAKVKELVNAVTAGQDNLFASFKKQREEEMGLMTPIEQGKYLMAMSQWRQKMMGKSKKK
jgi:Spy/CpxP family protein refolding chaperone